MKDKNDLQVDQKPLPRLNNMTKKIQGIGKKTDHKTVDYCKLRLWLKVLRVPELINCVYVTQRYTFPRSDIFKDLIWTNKAHIENMMKIKITRQNVKYLALSSRFCKIFLRLAAVWYELIRWQRRSRNSTRPISSILPISRQGKLNLLEWSHRSHLWLDYYSKTQLPLKVEI